MCLNTAGKPKKRWGIGYKHLELLSNGSLTNWDCIATAHSIIYPIGEWVTDPRDMIIFDHDGCEYTCGFHVSLTREMFEGIRDYPVVKVRFRKVVAGEVKPDEIYGDVVVAREIKVLEVLNEND